MDIMNRHKEWAVVIGLIGTGQEIHNGEAGLREWGNTIKVKHKDWVVFAPPEALNNEQLATNQTLFDSIPHNVEVHLETFLHLKTSIRSYKAALLSEWVAAVLNNEPKVAKAICTQIKNYPIIITRDLQKAKAWVRLHCRGTRNSGLVCLVRRKAIKTIRD